MATTRRRKGETVELNKALVSVPAPAKSPSLYALGGGNAQEMVVNIPKRERYAIYYEMYRQHPTVRAAVEKIAKTATVNGYTFKAEQPGEKVPDDEIASLKKFFRLSNANQLLRITYKDIIIFGESYWLIVGRKGGGRPVKAMRLHPMYMDIEREAGQPSGWRYGPMFETDNAIKYELGEVIHFKLDDPNSDVYGLSLLDSLQHTVASDLFAMRFNKKFFENAAQTGVIFNMKGATTDEVARNREWLEQNYTGVDNAHKAIILEGDMDVKKSVSTPQEMQFIEGRKFNRQEILSVLDISPSKLGITEDSNRSTSKEDDNTFRTENIASLTSIVEEEISNALILGMFGYDDVLFAQNESSMRDMLDLMKMFGEGENMGAFSPNYIKGQFGLPPVEGGDQHFIQTAAGLIPLDLIPKVAERLLAPPAPTAQGGGSAAVSGVGTGNAAGRGRPGTSGTKGSPGKPGRNGGKGTPGRPGTPGTSGSR